MTSCRLCKSTVSYHVDQGYPFDAAIWQLVISNLMEGLSERLKHRLLETYKSPFEGG